MFSFCLHQLDCIPSCSDPTTSEDTQHIVLVYTAMHPKLRGAPRTTIRTLGMRQGVKPNHFPRSLHTADGSEHRRLSLFACVSRSRSTTAQSALMIASTSASGVLHSVSTLPMSRAQFRLQPIYNSSLVIDHSLCNGLRFLSCVSMSLLRAMTSNLPWYLILPPRHVQPLLDFSGVCPTR